MGHKTIQMTLDHYTHMFPDNGDRRARLAAAEAKLFATKIVQFTDMAQKGSDKSTA
jgi:hypothetical protein